MAAGAMFLGEEVTVYHLIGLVLIIAGSLEQIVWAEKKASERMLNADRAEA